MPEAWPHLQRGVHASSLRALHQPPRVVQQQLVLPDLRQQRRQSVQVGVERRRQRLRWVRIAQVLARQKAYVLGREARVPTRLRAHRCARAGQVGPRRDAYQRGRQRQARVTGRDRQRDRQSAAGGVARHDHPRWIGAVCLKEPAVDGQCVVDRRREAVLRRQAVGRQQRPDARALRHLLSHQPVRGEGARGVPAAVEVEQHRVGLDTRRDDPLGRNAARQHGRNARPTRQRGRADQPVHAPPAHLRR